MMAEFLSASSKLRRYRELLNVSVERLSSETGLEIGRLLEIETGEVEPTGDELLILADFYKCNYDFLVSSKNLEPLEETSYLYRTNNKELTSSDRWAIQEILFLSENEAFLTAELNPQLVVPFQYESRTSQYIKAAEDAATALRAHLKYASAEIPHDVFQDIRKIGLHVFRRQLGNSGISGLCIRHPSAGACIVVNYSEDRLRQRFTAVHELAHAIFDISDEGATISGIWNSGEVKERRANRFAASYLLPKESVSRIRDATWSSDLVVDVSKKLHVNPFTLAIRLRTLGYIDQTKVEKFKNLKIPFDEKVDSEMSKDLPLAVRERRATLLSLGLSAYYVELCFQAYARELISKSKLASMLLTTESGVEEIRSLYGSSK